MTYTEPATDTLFAALADTTRRAILGRLAQGEATVTEIAAPFKMSQPAISQHLKILEAAGLILRRAEGTRRPCRLNPDGLDNLEAWLAALKKGLSRSYERLDELLADMTAIKSKRTST